ncbi:MAG: hypothetical protein LIP77_04440 [Planctomycetes bacterium]|nr:hypothetical protein [Planctomycetota bacterium]
MRIDDYSSMAEYYAELARQRAIMGQTATGVAVTEAATAAVGGFASTLAMVNGATDNASAAVTAPPPPPPPSTTVVEETEETESEYNAQEDNSRAAFRQAPAQASSHDLLSSLEKSSPGAGGSAAVADQFRRDEDGDPASAAVTQYLSRLVHTAYQM